MQDKFCERFLFKDMLPVDSIPTKSRAMLKYVKRTHFDLPTASAVKYTV